MVSVSGEAESGRLRDEIALSWRRSRLCGLAPGSGLAESGFADDLAHAGSLVRAARPVLDDLLDAARGAGVTLLLGDPEGRIVDRRTGTGKVVRVLDRRGVVPGMRYSEEAAGTNGLGTALELRHGVAVHGTEHFLEGLKGFSCYGQPIRHPVTRRVAGVLDITAVGRSANPLFRPLVMRAVEDIEQRLLAESPQSHLRLVAAFRQANREPGAAIAVDGDVTLSNPAAQDLLEPLDYAMLRGLAAASGPAAAGPTSTSAELASGLRVRVEVGPVPGSRSGRVFRVRRAERDGVVAPAGRAPAAGAAATPATPAAQVEALVVAVLGEPGSGVSTAARQTAADRGCTDIAVVDATGFDEYGAWSWLRRVRGTLRGGAAGGRRAVVVERADRLPAAQVGQLARLLEDFVARRGRADDGSGEPGAPAGAAVVILTAGARAGEDGGDGFAELLLLCGQRIDVPPLRLRRARFAAIVQRMLGESAAASRAPELRASAELVEVLAAHAWPGNFAELRAVLGEVAEVAARRADDLAQPGDLPARYRLGGKAVRMTGMDRAERDAVVSALAAAGGNKRRAAESLGISRTTLYSRLRSLDIRTAGGCGAVGG